MVQVWVVLLLILATVERTDVVAAIPTGQPTRQPSRQPSRQPTGQPTMQPSSSPSGQPSLEPTSQPSGQPSAVPSSSPTNQPSAHPSSQPSRQPTTRPSFQPTQQPTAKPTQQPSSLPSGQPSTVPSGQPSIAPSAAPSVPTGQPSRQPSGEPSSQPTGRPSLSSCPPGFFGNGLSICLPCPVGRYKANTAGNVAAPLTALSGCTACPAGTTSIAAASTTLSACSLCLPGFYYNAPAPPSASPTPSPTTPTPQPTAAAISGYALARRYNTIDCSGPAVAEYLYVYGAQCQGLPAGYDGTGQIVYRYTHQTLAAIAADGSSATLSTLNFTDASCVISAGAATPSSETIRLNACRHNADTRLSLKYTAVSRTALAHTLWPALVLTYYLTPDACDAHTHALASQASAAEVTLTASHSAAFSPGRCVFYSTAHDSGAGTNDGLYFNITTACSQKINRRGAEFALRWYNDASCSTSLDGVMPPVVSLAATGADPTAPGILAPCHTAWGDASSDPVKLEFSCSTHAPSASPTAAPTLTPAARACLPCPSDTYSRYLTLYNSPTCARCPAARYTSPSSAANTACLNYLNSLASFSAKSSSSGSSSGTSANNIDDVGWCIFPSSGCVNAPPYTPSEAVTAGHKVPSLRVEGSFFRAVRQDGDFNVTAQSPIFHPTDAASYLSYYWADKPLPLLVLLSGWSAVALLSLAMACRRFLPYLLDCTPSLDSLEDSPGVVVARRRRWLGVYVTGAVAATVSLQLLWYAYVDLETGAGLVDSGLGGMEARMGVLAGQSAAAARGVASFKTTLLQLVNSQNIPNSQNSQNNQGQGCITGTDAASLRAQIDLVSAALSSGNALQAAASASLHTVRTHILEGYADYYRPAMLGGVYTSGMLLILAFLAAVISRHQAATRWAVGLACLWSAALTGCVVVEMMLVMAGADFCLAPMAHLPSLTGSALTRRVLPFYAYCTPSGQSAWQPGFDVVESAVFSMLSTLTSASAAAAAATANTGASSSSASSLPACAASLRAAQGVLLEILSAKHAMEDQVSACAPPQRQLHTLLHQGVCGHAYTGFFTAWLLHIFANGSMLLMAVAAAVLCQFYDGPAWTMTRRSIHAEAAQEKERIAKGTCAILSIVPSQIVPGLAAEPSLVGVNPTLHLLDYAPFRNPAEAFHIGQWYNAEEKDWETAYK